VKFKSLNLLGVASVIAASSLLYAQGSLAGNIPIHGFGGHQIIADVTSYKEEQFKKVIRQKYDFSCGSAALATLLYYHYFYDVDEKQVLRAMYEVGDQEAILKKGFSLLDMKKYLESVGIPSDGYKLDLDKLAQAQVPAITLINNNGYLHFVVLKGVYEDVVLVGDPSLGLKRISRERFQKMWNGIAFVVKSDIPLAQQSFNLAEDWNFRKAINLGDSINNSSLANFTADITPTPNYINF
jgi:predicted double-glycine peptidase